MPIDTYHRHFPESAISCYLQDLILGTVTDLDVWEATVRYWKDNAYRPQSIGKMLDYYSNYRRPIENYVDAAVREFADVDPRLTEIAVLQVLMKRESTEPIKSINYFRPAVEEITHGMDRAEVKLKRPTYIIDAVLAVRRVQYDDITSI